MVVRRPMFECNTHLAGASNDRSRCCSLLGWAISLQITAKSRINEEFLPNERGRRADEAAKTHEPTTISLLFDFNNAFATLRKLSFNSDKISPPLVTRKPLRYSLSLRFNHSDYSPISIYYETFYDYDTPLISDRILAKLLNISGPCPRIFEFLHPYGATRIPQCQRSLQCIA